MSSTEDEVPPAPRRTLENCLSCRLVCGGGLIGAAAYVYAGARQHVRGGLGSMGTMAQIMFALGLASFGITVIARPLSIQPEK